MEIFALWLGLSVAVGAVASSRGRSGIGYFLLSMILSPLIGGVLAFGLPALPASGQGSPTPLTHVRCPDCRELVFADAVRCKHCGVKLIPQDLQARHPYEG